MTKLKIASVLLASALAILAVASIDVYPGQSIQAAVNSASAGDTIRVFAGNYAERVTVNKVVTLLAVGTAETDGFTVTSVGVTIKGFVIESMVNNSVNGVGIYVSGSDCKIINNTIRNTARGGIFLLYTTDNCLVKNNKITANVSQYGISVRGTNHVIEGNKIADIRQYSQYWINPPSYVDADGIRFHGSGHVIRNNYIYGIPYGGDNVDAHIDCFQTFDIPPYQPGAVNVLFENNQCYNAHAIGLNKWTSGWMLQDARDIILLGNVSKTYIGVNANGTSGLIVKNNTFVGNLTLPVYHPAGITLNNASAVIENNIFHEMLGHAIYQTNSTVSGKNNIMYRSGGTLWTTATYNHVNDLWGVDPLLGATYHPLANSPACLAIGYIGAYPCTIAPTITPSLTRTPTLTPTPTPTPTLTPTPTPECFVLNTHVGKVIVCVP